jgi:glycosyltransferase involved in cell wall biosynthesis
MMFLVYSETESGSIAENLGVPEYSYYFVLKEFRPLLEQMGIVVVLSDPEQEADRLWANAARHGESCVFLSFSPPHRSFIPAHCPTIPVFAWEFDTLPTESWEDDSRHDWRSVLTQSGRAITHSNFAVETTKATMGRDFPVISLPAPVWDAYAGLYDPAAGGVKQSAGIAVRGRVFDTRALDLAPFSSVGRRLMGQPSLPAEAGTKQTLHELMLDGVVYSSVFCPMDGRKNWFDMLCGFCLAFRDVEDATLVLKLTHHDCDVAVFAMLGDLAKLQPFRCRVVLIDGYLPDDAYMQLAALSSYTVCTSHGEGQCLPLMEYMSAGKPAIAPAHTAMADYITPANGFVLTSTHEPATWPHDPRQAFRTRRHRIDFEILMAAYRESYEVAKHNPARYTQMAAAAHYGLKEHCSRQKIRDGLLQFLQPLAMAAE